LAGVTKVVLLCADKRPVFPESERSVDLKFVASWQLYATAVQAHLGRLLVQITELKLRSGSSRLR
jgi:hypothetical protein